MGDWTNAAWADAIEISLPHETIAPLSDDPIVKLPAKFNGEQPPYFDVHNPYCSSVYEQAETRFLDKPVAEPRQVRVRRLDTLLVAAGVRPGTPPRHERGRASAVWHRKIERPALGHFWPLRMSTIRLACPIRDLARSSLRSS
jgi:hypothetical protein